MLKVEFWSVNYFLAAQEFKMKKAVYAFSLVYCEDTKNPTWKYKEIIVFIFV